MKTADLCKQVTQQILDALDAGPPPWRKMWRGGGRLAYRYTGEPYLGINQLILGMTAWAREYQSATWLTFRQAKAAGGNVRKGEKGTQIVFFKTLPPKEDDDGTVYRPRVMRCYTVFNIDQCDGIEDPIDEGFVSTIAEEDPEEWLRIIDQVQRNAARVTHGPSPCYIPALDVIKMPMRTDFTSHAAYVATLLHECIHSTGHAKRLGREAIIKPHPGRKSKTYAFEELVAELGSAFTCARLGIEGEHIDNHAAYIASWKKLLTDDDNAIFRAAAQAQQASDFLLGEEHEDQSGHPIRSTGIAQAA